MVWSCGRTRGSRRDASRAPFFCCPAAPAVAVTAAAAGVDGVGMVWWWYGGVVVIPGPSFENLLNLVFSMAKTTNINNKKLT